MKGSSILIRPVDIAPLAVFRMLMGLIMAAEGFGAILTGWVGNNYVKPDFTFNFIGFDFLQYILVGPQAYFIYFFLGLAGLGIALGYRYKLSVGIYTALWSLAYLGQKTSYNNHYFLLWIFCFVLLAVPANRYASLDVKLGRIEKVEYTEYLNIWIFKIILFIVYFYAALAKLYPDWLEGIPVRIFLSSKGEMPLVGPLIDKDWFVYLISYGGIAFDFLIIPALWFKPTRNIAFAIAIFFHLFNSIVFRIGIFPYMMLASVVLFYPAITIRKLFFPKRPKLPDSETKIERSSAFKKSFLLILLVFMVASPLRPFYYPGWSHWSEEAHRMSWHMMLRSKSGYGKYIVKFDEGRSEIVRPADRMSEKMAQKLATHPDMIWQYAQRLKLEYEGKGHEDVEVYAHFYASLNGRTYQLLIDPEINLANQEWSHIEPHSWIKSHPELSEN